MLKTPDVHTARILALADHMLTVDDYDQNEWDNCICGQAMRNYCIDSKDAVCDFLGISYSKGLDLFQAFHNDHKPSQVQAAKVLRHLAITGEVNWRVAANARLGYFDA